jgi:hypothetical protein
MTRTPSPAARETARRLLARELAGAGEPAAVAAAMQALCVRIAESLQRSVGKDGYDALLARVLGPAEADHPVLSELCRLDQGGIRIDHVAAGVAAHGTPVVTAALEGLIAGLLEVLGSLVGADMALNLLELDGPPSSASNNGQRP